MVLIEPSTILKEGWVTKESALLKTYRSRWLVLTNDRLCTFESERVYQAPTEDINLHGRCGAKMVSEPGARPFSFAVQAGSRSINMAAASEAERDGWVKAIQRVLSERGSGERKLADDAVLTAVEAQRALFASGATRSVAWRCEQIRKLCGVVAESADKISEAQAADGVVPSHFAGAVGMLMGAMGYYLAMVPKWSAPLALEDTLPPDRRMGVECEWVRVMEPKGLVLNIAPWNAPVLLSVLPCLGALAAGNTCVIKPPEATPKTSELLASLVAAALAPEAVTVVQGDAAVGEALIDLGFDHIMFTGGTSIGRLVMARAARTLTPVTLELGGKNPVLIDVMDDGMLAACVKEIVGTKAYFAGEFCQCHDYVLVVDAMWERFTQALGDAISALGEKRNVRMINARHYGRVKAFLSSHRGTNLPPPPSLDDASLCLPVTAVLEPSSDDKIMVEEIFGPFWPVLRVASVEEGISRARAVPTGKPLVSYYYGQDASHADLWLSGTSSGALAINAGPMRMQSNFNAAIHGVGNSGLGGASIWGEHVFNTFSHAKHVVRPKGGAFAGSVWGAGAYHPSA